MRRLGHSFSSVLHGKRSDGVQATEDPGTRASTLRTHCATYKGCVGGGHRPRVISVTQPCNEDPRFILSSRLSWPCNFSLTLRPKSHHRAATAPAIVSVFKAGRVEDKVGPAMFFLLSEKQKLLRKPPADVPLCVCISFLSQLYQLPQT